MARPITARRVQLAPAIPDLVVEELDYFDSPRGMNTLTKLSKLPREFSPLVKNMRLNRGYLSSRLGVATLGIAATDPVMGIVDFVTARGNTHVVRFTTTGIEQYQGGVWNAISGVAFTGSLSDYFTVAAWRNNMLVDNGIDGIFDVNLGAGTGTRISESFASKHITTFASRVIASGVRDSGFQPYRIRWSAKLNHEDWTSQGSGFEDLLAAPGTGVDAVHGIFPVSDTIALMVRSRSIWQVSQTGLVETPFLFSRLLSEIGSDAPQTIVAIPGGVVFLGIDDIYIITPSGPQVIGEPIRRQILDNISLPREAYGAYDPFRGEYRLGVREGLGTTSLNVIWTYSFADKGWTRAEYPFDVRAFSFTRFTTGLTIGQLTGTIGDLVGPIGELGVTERSQGMYFAMGGTGRFIVREEPNDRRDVLNSGIEADSPIELRTGLVKLEDHRRTQIMEIRLIYEAVEEQTLNFEYSINGGDNWLPYILGVRAPPTVKPETLVIRRRVDVDWAQIRLADTVLGQLDVIKMTVRAVRGAEIRSNPRAVITVATISVIDNASATGVATRSQGRFLIDNAAAQDSLTLLVDNIDEASVLENAVVSESVTATIIPI